MTVQDGREEEIRYPVGAQVRPYDDGNALTNQIANWFRCHSWSLVQ